jgi:hypothetical protein
MGLFDKMKKKAQGAINQAQNVAAPSQDAPPMAEQPVAAAAQASHDAPAAVAHSGPTFTYDGDTFPLPDGWSGLSSDDFFYKREQIVDDQMNIDDVGALPDMTDEDGDELDREEVLLITKYGFKNGGHWEALSSWSMEKAMAETGEDMTTLVIRMSSIARQRLTAEKAKAMSGPGGALEPVEGVSVEAWAKIQAVVAGGGDFAPMIAEAGMDQPKWDRVSAEWNSRMSTDHTATIATVYSNAFAGGGQYGAAAANAASAGVAGDVGAEPCTFEKWVEVGCAQSAGAGRGEDAAAILNTFGMSVVDWSSISMYWGTKFMQEAGKYHALHTEYTAKYDAKYG